MLGLIEAGVDGLAEVALDAVVGGGVGELAGDPAPQPVRIVPVARTAAQMRRRDVIVASWTHGMPRRLVPPTATRRDQNWRAAAPVKVPPAETPAGFVTATDGVNTGVLLVTVAGPAPETAPSVTVRVCVAELHVIVLRFVPAPLKVTVAVV